MNKLAITLSPIKLRLTAFLIIFSIGLIGVYELFLQNTNEYMGYRPLIFSFGYFFGLTE